MANIVQKIKEELTFENVLQAAFRTPGVKIKRDTFLKKRTYQILPRRSC